MSARKDYDKLLKDLRRAGWHITETGNSAEVTHVDGKRLKIECNNPCIRQARQKIRRIEEDFEEQQRQRIRAANAVPGATVSQPQRSRPPMNPKVPVNDEKKAPEDILFDLLVDQDKQLKNIAAALAQLGSAVANIGNMVTKAEHRYQAEQQEKHDKEAYDRRIAFLDAELKDLPAGQAKVVQFDAEAELVVTSTLAKAYGNKTNKEFRTTREGLHVSFWRVK